MNRVQKQWPYPRIIAHRGAGHFAPENTLGAIMLGAKSGHQMVEFDVTLTQDNISFLLHDDTLIRTAGLNQKASSVAWHDIKNLDAGSWHSEDYKNEKLPTLAQVALLSQQLGLAVNIEIKPAKGLESETGHRLGKEITTLFDKSDYPPLISSFSYQALKSIRQTAPALMLGQLAHHWHDNLITQACELECLALHLNVDILTQARINRIKAAGLCIFVYTVNHIEKVNELFDMGVDDVCTDEIKLISPRDFSTLV